jgi:hypothetical protein
MNLFDVSVQLYLLNENIIIAQRKIQYFTYHAERCKKLEDKIRLVLLSVSELAIITATAIIIKKITDNLFNSMIPKMPEQKLIEFKGGFMLND